MHSWGRGATLALLASSRRRRGGSVSTPTVGLNCHFCCACPASHAGARVRVEELAAVRGMCAPLADASLHAPLCKVSTSTPLSPPLLLCRRRRRPPPAAAAITTTPSRRMKPQPAAISSSQPPSNRKNNPSGSIVLTSSAPVPVPIALVRIPPSPTPHPRHRAEFHRTLCQTRWTCWGAGRTADSRRASARWLPSQRRPRPSSRVQ